MSVEQQEYAGMTQSLAEQKRFRTGVVTLTIGVLLVVWAWGSWMYRTSAEKPALADSAGTDAVTPAAPAINALTQIVLYGMILIIVLAVGSLAISRSIRRFITRSDEPRTPTPSSDVWSMYNDEKLDLDRDNPGRTD